MSLKIISFAHCVRFSSSSARWRQDARPVREHPPLTPSAKMEEPVFRAPSRKKSVLSRTKEPSCTTCSVYAFCCSTYCSKHLPSTILVETIVCNTTSRHSSANVFQARIAAQDHRSTLGSEDTGVSPAETRWTEHRLRSYEFRFPYLVPRIYNQNDDRQGVCFCVRVRSATITTIQKRGVEEEGRCV